MPNTPSMTILPQYQGDAYTLANKQALAQAIMQQASQQQNTQAVGSGPYQIVPKYSIGGGLAQLGQALIAAKLQNQVAQGYRDLGQQQWASLSGSAPQSSVGGTADGSSQSGTTPNPFQSSPQALASALGGSGGTAPAQTGAASPQQSGTALLAPGSALNPSGMDQGKAAYLYLTMGPTEYAKNFVAPYVKPTDATLMARQGGVDTGAANRDALVKANNLPFNSYGPNMILQDPHTGQMSATPSAAPNGSYTVLTPNGPQVVQTPGALDAMRNAAAAQAGGEGSQLPYAAVDAQGNPVPITNRTAAANQRPSVGGQPPPIPTLPGAGGAAPASGVPLPGGPVPGGGGLYAAPPMGAQEGATAAAKNQQDELSKKWTDLNAQNQQAQTTTSYLQNIKSLATRAATGQQVDRLNYVNGLLSLAGSEKATDAVTANNLLDKYSNQITARLGAGGMGTDAARSILQSAYPNAKMTPQAINEAADNLVGANQMVQAKTRLLAPFRNKNDPQGYTNAELTFDQNADPRIYQYANIKDPTARKAFAQSLMQSDPSIVQKIQTLQSLGALK